MTLTARAASGIDAIEVGAEAVVFLGAGRPLERIVVPGVVLRPGEVLVAVELVTLCPEDADILNGTRAVHGPVVLGHEQVGRVVALPTLRRPRAIDGRRLAVGDRVVWAEGVGRNRYGHHRVERGWELSGGCATHVQLLARTPIARVGDDQPAASLAMAACGTFSADQLRAGLSARVGFPHLRIEEFALADAEQAIAAVVAGRRVAVRPMRSSPG